MAIRTATQDDLQSNTQALGGNAQPEQPRQPAAGAPQRFNPRGIGSTSIFSIVEDSKTEIVNSLHESFVRLCEKNSKDQPVDYNVILLDNGSVQQLYYSTLVLVATPRLTEETRQILRLAPNEQPPVAYHYYLIEASGKDIQPVNRTLPASLGNNLPANYDSMLLPSDAGDSVLESIIRPIIEEQYRGVRTIIGTRGEVIPKSFTKEANNAGFSDSVSRIFINGQQAIRKAIDFAKNPNDFNIGMLGSNQISIRLERTSSGIEFNSSGLPCRADVQLEIITRQQDNNIVSLNRGGDHTTHRVSGYFDFVWNAEERPSNFMVVNPQDQGMRDKPFLQPMFVVTKVEMQGLQSLPNLLCVLSALSVLAENNNWKSFLIPRQGFGKNRNRDLERWAALGVEFSHGQQGPFSDPELFLQVDRFMDLINNACHQSLLLAVDIEECGANSWMFEDLLAASEGNQAGIRNILKAADYLVQSPSNDVNNPDIVGSQIEQNWLNTNASLVNNLGGRIHMGFYYDMESGQNRDIRDVDYLTVLSHNVNDLNIVREYCLSYTNVGTSFPLDYLLYQRRKEIDKMTPTYTGYGRRVVINMRFIDLLARELAHAGVTFRPELPYVPAGELVRSPIEFASMFSSLPASTGLFNSAGMNGQRPMYANTPNTMYGYSLGGVSRAGGL